MSMLEPHTGCQHDLVIVVKMAKYTHNYMRTCINVCEIRIWWDCPAVGSFSHSSVHFIHLLFALTNRKGFFMRVSVCLKLRCYLNKTSMEVFRPAAVCVYTLAESEWVMKFYRWFSNKSEDGTPGRWNKRYTRYAAINHCRNYYEIYIQIDSMYQLHRVKTVCMCGNGLWKSGSNIPWNAWHLIKFSVSYDQIPTAPTAVSTMKNGSGLFEWHHSCNWNPALSLASARSLSSQFDWSHCNILNKIKNA